MDQRLYCGLTDGTGTACGPHVIQRMERSLRSGFMRSFFSSCSVHDSSPAYRAITRTASSLWICVDSGGLLKVVCCRCLLMMKSSSFPIHVGLNDRGLRDEEKNLKNLWWKKMDAEKDQRNPTATLWGRRSHYHSVSANSIHPKLKSNSRPTLFITFSCNSLAILGNYILSLFTWNFWLRCICGYL